MAAGDLESSDKLDSIVDRIDLPREDVSVLILDRFYGFWEIRIEWDSNSQWNLSVRKISGVWKIHSAKA